MIFSLNIEKAFDKDPIFMINVLEISGIQRIYLNIIKSTLTANIRFNGWKQSYYTKIRNKTSCSLSPDLFNIVFEFLASAMRQ